MDSHQLHLVGSSGTAHIFEESGRTVPDSHKAAVFALLSYHGEGEEPTVLYVGQSEDPATAVAEHLGYPCQNTFVNAVASLPAGTATERDRIRIDLSSALKPPCEGCWPPVPTSPDVDPFPDRVIGGCLAERQLLDQRLADAVSQRQIIRFVHDGRQHEVEPHAYGVQADGRPVLFAYRPSSAAAGNALEGWRTFPVSEIHALIVTEIAWGAARPMGPCPIDVLFAGRRSAVRDSGPKVEQDSAEAMEGLRLQVEEAVRRLRAQVLELSRLEGWHARLEHRLEHMDGPQTLASALERVADEQARVRAELLEVIPEVAALQRRLEAPAVE